MDYDAAPPATMHWLRTDYGDTWFGDCQSFREGEDTGKLSCFVGARYKHVRIHEKYRSTYIPLGLMGHSPRLEQAPSARDPF